MKKWTITVGAIIAVAMLILVVGWNHPPSREVLQQLPLVSQLAKTKSSPSTSTLTQTQTKKEDSPDPHFSSWLASSGLALDSTSNNASAIEAELIDIAENLSATQLSILLKQIQSEDSPAGERIVAYYLLAHSKGAALNSLLNDLMQKGKDIPFTDPHSIAALRATQARAERVMAIDLLADRAKKGDAEAQATLEKLANESADPQIRAFAAKRLKEK